jgi:hypothetical protein
MRLIYYKKSKFHVCCKSCDLFYYTAVLVFRNASRSSSDFWYFLRSFSVRQLWPRSGMDGNLIRSREIQTFPSPTERLQRFFGVCVERLNGGFLLRSPKCVQRPDSDTRPCCPLRTSIKSFRGHQMAPRNEPRNTRCKTLSD